jgi:co-chaperonin GroES (HSP10)
MLRQKPYGNRIIVEISGPQTITSTGGALLSQADTAIGTTAKILAVGQNVISPMCQVGMEAIFPPEKALEVYLDGKKYHTLLEHEVYFFQPALPESKSEDRLM